MQLLRRHLVALSVSITMIAILLLAIWTGHRHEPSSMANSVTPVLASKSSPASSVSAFSDEVILRPLPVSRKTATHEWTAGDGTSPAIIEKIAHNPDEFIRMVEENERIKRRQLVYRSEPLPLLIERSRGSGKPLTKFTLPGLDGQEVEVEVKEIHEEPSMHGGSVIGRVKGRFNSMVSVGFVNGYESFNVFSPEDGLYLTADAREPGEVIVKEIDPDKYAPISGSEPDFILTQEPLPNTHGH